jgi:hypothetical protein
MHTCEVVVRNYGELDSDLCGEPATKSVVMHNEASGAPRKSEAGTLVWVCDEHYGHAANWGGCDF